MPMMMMNHDTKLAPKKTSPVTGSRVASGFTTNTGKLRRKGCLAASLVKASVLLMARSVNAPLTIKASRNAG